MADTGTATLSDKALSIFAFAAFHQLESGQPVAKVVRRDGKGHQADPAGVEEIVGRDLATATDDEISFTEAGVSLVNAAVEGLRQALAKGA
ncbi:MAG TPA: hypothetical protein VIL65_08355 [Beijerinckiaceae bacterium]|jgi:hypothetical protein